MSAAETTSSCLRLSLKLNRALVLEIFTLDAQMIDSNDNWESHESADELPESLTPSRRPEAAMTTSLEPGAYTAIVRGKGSATSARCAKLHEGTRPPFRLAEREGFEPSMSF